MMYKVAALGDTVYFWFGANDTSGSGGDGASPAADVRLAGAAADAAPVYSPTPVLLSHANYPAGCYEVAIAATAGNGFAAGNEYAVFCTLAIDSQNPTGFVGSFSLVAAGDTLIDAAERVIDNLDATVSSRSTFAANDDVTVAAMDDNVITAAAIATDAIGELELAAAAASEIGEQASDRRLKWRSTQPT